MRFGDVFPDNWEKNDKFENAYLVSNRLWKFLEGKGTIWIQTSPSSDSIHLYVYSNQTGKYLCGNCSTNGRYSRAKLAKLPNGQKALFEYQEHFHGCRLPLRLFDDGETSNNSTRSYLHGSELNRSRNLSFNAHVQAPVLNVEAFGLNSVAFEVVPHSEQRRARFDDVYDVDSTESNVDYGLDETISIVSSASSVNVVQDEERAAFVQSVVKDSCKVEQVDDDNDCIIMEVVEKRTSICVENNPKNNCKTENERARTDADNNDHRNERTLEKEQHSFVSSASFVNVVQDEERASVVQSMVEDGCKVDDDDDCVIIEVVQKKNSISLESNPGNNCQTENESSRIDVDNNDDQRNERTSEKEQRPTFIANTSPPKSKYYGDLYKSGPLFAKATKVMDRTWILSDDEQVLWCQSDKDSNMWYAFSGYSNNRYTCSKCHNSKHRRYSVGKLVIEIDDSKSLWTVENHEEECLKEYAEVLEGKKEHEKDILEDETVAVSSPERRSVYYGGCELDSENHELDERIFSNFDEASTDTLRYGEKYGIGSTRPLGRAVEVKDREWKLSKDEKHVICQTESNPKLWYIYLHKGFNRFLCSRCKYDKRTSVAKIIEEGDTKTLWAFEDHGQECVRTQRSLAVEFDFEIDDDCPETTSSSADGTKSMTYGEKYNTAGRYLANALEVTDRIWKLSKNGKYLLCQSESNPKLYYSYLLKTNNIFFCSRCRTADRSSLAKVVEENESKELWVIENHEKECLRMDEELESDLESEIEECDENEEVMDPTVVKYGDVRKIPDGRSAFWADALNAKNRLWKLSKDGRFILLQKQKNSNFWYLFTHSHNNIFKCGRCAAKKRVSRLKIIDEKDGSKSLWTIENHDKKCSKSYGKIINLLSRYSSVRKLVEKFEDFDNYFTTFGKRQPLNVEPNMESILTENRSKDKDEVVRYGDVCDLPSHCKMANAVKLTNRLWKLSKSEKNILCQSESSSTSAYSYYLSSKNLFRCKTCEKSKRYSAIKIDVDKNGSQFLWAVENHAKECLRIYLENDFLFDSDNEESMLIEQSARSSSTAPTEIIKYGDVHKITSEFDTCWTEALKVTDRIWKISKVKKHLLLQTEPNSNLWYFFSYVNKTTFKCGTCLMKKRFSRAKIVREKDGTKTLWTIENHEKECSKAYRQIAAMLNRVLPLSGYSSVMIRTVEDIENFFINQEHSKNCPETFEDVGTSKILKYSDLYDVSSNSKFGDAVKITNREWKILKNGKNILCQSENDPELWYFYRNDQSNSFSCLKCDGRKYTRIKLVTEEDGTKTLWGLENHGKQCLKKLDEIMKRYRRLFNTENSEESPESLRYGDLYPCGAKFVDALKITDRTWKFSKDRAVIWCQSKEDENLWYLYRRISSETFRCMKCQTRKLYSAAKVIEEDDGSQTLWAVENHTEQCLLVYDKRTEKSRKSGDFAVLEGTNLNDTSDADSESADDDSENENGRTRILRKRRFGSVFPDDLLDDSDSDEAAAVVEKKPCLNNLRNENDDPRLQHFIDFVTAHLPNEKLDLFESYLATKKSEMSELDDELDTESITSLEEDYSNFPELPENLWILPCSANNIAKDYLFIVSKENPNFGSKLVLQGKFESNLIFCCQNCDESKVKAVVCFKNDKIHIKFVENDEHQKNCYKIDLLDELSKKSRILVNSIGQ